MQPAYDYVWPTHEGAEIHSMGLEFLAWGEMERFFGDGAGAYRALHLAERLMLLPYAAAVDHFQHLVYEQPHATPAERHAMWQGLERRYLPWRFYGDLERPASGAFWQSQLHIFKVPFYYIDYTLAQCVAFQMWDLAANDPADALERYLRLCRLRRLGEFRRPRRIRRPPIPVRNRRPFTSGSSCSLVALRLTQPYAQALDVHDRRDDRGAHREGDRELTVRRQLLPRDDANEEERDRAICSHAIHVASNRFPKRSRRSPISVPASPPSKSPNASVQRLAIAPSRSVAAAVPTAVMRMAASSHRRGELMAGDFRTSGPHPLDALPGLWYTEALPWERWRETRGAE